ncbi:murein hydrolase activator EnvC family protein [Leptolyngbya sp. AN02str]|uniref:murein hydrolase activator EnvC family protein n=1 Tax=Leptolyngbya sp. AN02str TaxID=3423363 RepID=UPI003D314BBD
MAVALISLACIVGMVAIAPAVRAQSPILQAQSVESLQQQRQQIEKKREEVKQQRQEIQNLEQSTQQRLEGLSDQIENTAEEIKDNEVRLAQANTRLKKLEEEYAEAERAYQQQQSATVGRLKFLQRQQGSRGWAVLLQSRNLNEFLDRRYQLRRVYAADRQMLEHLEADANKLEQRRRDVERQKNEIALLTQELLSRKAAYEQQADVQEGLLSRFQRDRQALEEAESQLERDSSNLAGLIRQRLDIAARSSAVIRGTGIFSIPTEGRLTSNFGYRVHPILGKRRFHAGIDFGAPQGTTIRAADTGVVIYAGWYGGYGRSVIIDHGNRISTLYAHSSRIFVAEGQRVERGQAIAAVGSTGFSTGPHLHFEVRRNGEPVNPIDFF